MSDKHVQRVKIIEKVRALLTMTVKNGCTEAEAMTAAAMAAKLMEQYDLAIADVKSVHDERIARESKPFSSSENHRQMHAAGIYVAVAVGEFFDCKCWRDHTEIIFFGLKYDVELAHIMLTMIRFAMDRELVDFLKSGAARGEHPRALAASFAKGMGYRVSERLRQLKAVRTANVKAKGRDLVVVKGQLVDAAFAKLFPRAFRKARDTKPSSSAIAYAAGIEAGDRVAIGEERKIERPVRPARKRKAPSAVNRAPTKAAPTKTATAEHVGYFLGRLAGRLIARVRGMGSIWSSRGGSASDRQARQRLR